MSPVDHRDLESAVNYVRIATDKRAKSDATQTALHTLGSVHRLCQIRTEAPGLQWCFMLWLTGEGCAKVSDPQGKSLVNNHG